MQIITQLLSLIIFAFILLNNLDFMLRLKNENFQMMLFILVNLATSIVQVFLFYILIATRASKLMRFIIHLLLSSVVLSLLVIGCYIFFQNSMAFQSFEQRPNKDKYMIT